MSMILEPRKPVGTGMTVKRVGYIDTKKIIIDRNKARKKGIIPSSVAKFEKLMMRGKYEPQYYVPPVVTELPNGYYELVSGEHRVQAHRGQKKTKIWVAIVEFDTSSNKYLYQSIENKKDEDYVSTPREFEDIVNSAISVLKEDGYVDDKKPSNNYIWKVVDKLQISTEEASKNDIYEEIRRQIGSTTVDVHTYSAAVAAEKAATIHGNSTIPYTTELYKNISGKTGDTDIRMYMRMAKEKETDPANPYWVYGHWSKVDGENIPTARVNKEEFWKALEKNIVRLAEILQHPDYVPPVLKPLPQIDNDD